MKKIFGMTVSVILLLACVFSLSACTNSKVVGVYEMTDVSGTMTANGQTVQLSKDLYEYYTIEFKKNGDAVVKSKASGSAGAYIENSGTWTERGGVIKLKSSQGGISVVEEMKWENDVITYVAKQSASGVTIDMTLTLKKKV